MVSVRLLFCFMTVSALAQEGKLAKEDIEARKRILQMGAPFDGVVTTVHNLSSGTRGWVTYKTIIETPKLIYTAYCINVQPIAGKTYQIIDAFVDKNVSILQLWPVDRKELHLTPDRSTRGKAFRVLILQNANERPGARPDAVCDLRSVSAR